MTLHSTGTGAVLLTRFGKVPRVKNDDMTRPKITFLTQYRTSIKNNHGHLTRFCIWDQSPHVQFLPSLSLLPIYVAYTYMWQVYLNTNLNSFWYIQCCSLPYVSHSCIRQKRQYTLSYFSVGTTSIYRYLAIGPFVPRIQADSGLHDWPICHAYRD